MDKMVLEKLKTLTILYVEDEEGIRKKISDSLKYYAKEVLEAKDGEEGLRLYHEKNPDIIYTDILMPKMDGISLVKEIRKNDKKIPIVLVTAHTEKSYLLNAVELHLEQYIVKPISLKELKNSLKKCLDVILENHPVSVEIADEYIYEAENKIIRYKDKAIKLQRKEIMFLELLIQNRHKVVTYEELQDVIWQDDIMTDGALKTLVGSLRQKLPKHCIKNLSGIGYKLTE